jgi:ribosome maturation factor RimP
VKNIDLDRITQTIEPTLAGMGYELVDLEWKNEAGWVLRVFIDKHDGEAAALPASAITLDDCTQVSHQLSATLDVADLIGPAYSLEVSSPGLNRPLRKEADFRRFVGQKAKIRTRHPVGESRRNFSGVLVSVDQGTVRIDVGDQVCDVPVADVEKANLVYDFSQGQGR